jgi:hypothetical protein
VLWIHSWSLSHWIRNFIWWFWDICRMQYEENYPKCGLWEAGSFTTMCLHHTQWCQTGQNIQFLPFHIPPPPPPFFWPLPFYTLNLKLNLEKTTSDSRKQPLWRKTSRRSHKHPLNIASKNGNVSWWDAMPCTGTILKETVFSKLKAEKDII